MPTVVLQPVDDVLGAVEALLGDYPIAGPHVALAGRGPVLARAAKAAARATGARLLLAGEPDDPRWAWLATTAVGAIRAAAADEHAQRPDPAPLGLAGPASGREGFRTAHRHARLAHAGAELAGLEHAVVTLADVTLEALVAGDADDAREIVRAELGALAAPGPASARLRATVEASLAHGTSGVPSRLGTDPRTVAYRLRRAEMLLGRPLGVRRVELAAALRLFDRLGA